MVVACIRIALAIPPLPRSSPPGWSRVVSYVFDRGDPWPHDYYHVIIICTYSTGMTSGGV